MNTSPQHQQNQQPPQQPQQLTPEQKQQQKQQQRRENMQLVRTLGSFKPKSATDVQYYNFLREYCIFNNCSVEYGIEHAGSAWRKLGEKQRACYESELCTLLPIPVPLHQVYEALRDEKSGLLTLTKIESGKTTRYVIKSYNIKAHERNRTRREMERKYLSHFENAADLAVDTGLMVPDRSPRKIRKHKQSKLMEDHGKPSSKPSSLKKNTHAKRSANTTNTLASASPSPSPTPTPKLPSPQPPSPQPKQSTLKSMPYRSKLLFDHEKFHSIDQVDQDLGGAGDASSKTRNKRQKHGRTTTKTKQSKKTKV